MVRAGTVPVPFACEAGVDVTAPTSPEDRARLRSAGLALMLLCLLAGACVASTLTSPQYHHTAWTMQDGAPADIWGLAQGRDGYLWLGTGTGLYRFDGVQFEQFHPPQDKPFASSNITALYTASDGALWIGFLIGGVSVLRDGQLTHYPIAAGAPADLVLAFAEDSSGAIWTAARGGFRRFDGQRWHTVGANWGYPASGAHSLLTDEAGTLWVTTGQTLLYLPSGARKFRSTREPVGLLATLTEAPDGTIWLSDGLHGTRPLHDARDPQRVPHALPMTDFAHLASMRIDDAGALWGTDRTVGGVMRVSNLNRFQNGRSLRPGDFDATIRKRDGLSSDRTIPVLRDREGNIWIGTNLGLHRFRLNSVRALQDERLNQHSTYGMAYSPKHGLLVSNDRFLYRIHEGAPELFAETDGAEIHALVAAGEGVLWAKTDHSLLRLERGRLESVATPLANTGVVSVIASDGKAGLLLMQDTTGLHHFDGKRWSRVGIGVIQPLNATALAQGTNGDVWIGYPGSVLARWDGRRQHIYSSRDGLSVGTITAIAPVEAGLLVAGETGLVLLRDERIHPLLLAVPERLHGITGIVASRHGDIWLNGIRGVVRISARDLAAIANEPNRLLEDRIFDLGDGMLGVAQQYTPAPTAIADGDGRLWFATNQGLATVDPENLRSNRVVPPVHIRALTAANRRRAAENGLRLPKGTKNVRFEYTALSLSAPERVRFRYRLEDVDADWQEVGNRRQAFYANLGPGNYRFQVIAANDSGVWNEQGDSFDFVIEPRFTQTWWFAALCAIAAGGLLFSLYLLRLRQIAERVRMRLEERHNERERIARELHDTLLQGIQGLVLRFQAIANRIPTDDPLHSAMEKALDRADEAIAEGRDRVRDLRATMMSLPIDLPEAFARVGAELAESHPADFSVVVEGRLPAMDPCIRDEVYWIGREVLTNAFRHANATRIEVEISCGHELLAFRFRDNGQGMGDDIRRNGEKPGHWGLAGMRERAKAISGELNIWSREGKGTEVELVMRKNAASRGARKPGWRERLTRRWRA
jgi:signal transduction histidine kinase/ligand-binding sensor domain-containing protein